MYQGKAYTELETTGLVISRLLPRKKQLLKYAAELNVEVRKCLRSFQRANTIAQVEECRDL